MIKTRFYLPFALILCCCTALSAQYLENFTGQNGKGLVDAICPAGTTNINNCGSACTANATDNTSTCTTVPPSFSGVNWTLGLGPSSTYFTDPNPNPFGFEFGSPDDFGVVSDRIQVDDTDQEICWISPTLNIGAAGAVSISVAVSQTGALETGDFVRGDYSLNGGAYVQFGFQEGNFASTNLTVSGLTGSTLVIRVCAKTNGTGEQIYIDDISVPQAGVTTGCNPPTISAVVSQVGTCNPNSGAINLTVGGAVAPYMYSWSNLPGSPDPQDQTGLAAGVYSVTVTDATFCSATTSITVTTATALALSTQVLPADCPGAATGEIDLTVNNGVPPYSYSWSNLPGAGDPQDQIGLTAGSYTVTVTDNAGCTSTTSATIGTAAAGAYSETFSIDGKGILDNSTCSGANGTTCTNNNFVGVNWSIYGLSTLSGVDVNDYFKTTGGKLEHKDIDQDVCWESPLIDINPPGTGVAFSVDLAWNDFDREPGQDYIDVEYSLDGGAWTRVSNQVGGGTSGHTIVYASGGANDLDGSTTVNATGLSGSTLRIRVCGLANSETETYTIDNVSVPLSNGLYCPCPTISFTATPTNTCPGSNNGQIAVSGVSGGTGPYMYSKDNGVNYQSGATFTGLAAGNYQIVVKDASACTGGPQSVTVGTFTAPSCSISTPGAPFVCNSTEGVVFTAPAGMSAYNWSISGAGGSIPGSTTGSSVSVTTGNYLADFTLFLTVTDGNGCTSTCSSQFFNYLLKPPANITVSPGATVCFGVTLDLSIAAAASSTVAWTGEGITNPNGNPSTMATPTTTGPHTYSVTVTTDYGCSNTGTANVTINPLPNVTCPGNSNTCLNTPSYALSGASPGGGTYSGPGVSGGMFDPAAAGAGPHTITYTVTDGNGCSNSCTFTITVQVCNIDFDGKIIFSNNNSLGVENANVTLTGSATGSDLSDSNGDFFISTAVSSGSFTLTPAKTANKLNGVTVGDAYAIQLHVANNVPITDPYKLVAADVNKSNSITTTDASIINQSVLGNPAALVQFKTSWRFAPTSHTMSIPPWGFPEQRTYTNINTPQTSQNFYGIKTGDVVTAFANPANFGAGNPLIFHAEDQTLTEEQEIAVEFKAGQLADLVAFQFALKFDVEKLELAGIQPNTGLPLTDENFGTFNLSEGEIRAAWSQVEGMDLEEAAPIFSLKFKVLQSGGKLSEALRLDEGVLPALAYNSPLEESKVELKLSELTGTGDPAGAAGVQLLQNRPNPFNGTTAIGFVLPEAGEAQLRVFDVAGKMLAERKGQYPAGRNEEMFDLSGASGVLYYELTTPFGVLAKKMVAVAK
ncbi:MAG: hypothetical protein DYG98_25865 [Haliscomenobacteraceae bacterium CHB4]|nr:hypothetical protein [Haliscomenobacteraceae bacterium CHB4]